MCGSAIAEEPARFPVPATAIYPGDLIKEEMIIDRAFAPNMPGAAAFVSERPMAVGRIARRTLLPGQLIPINALEEQKIVTRGNVVKVIVEDGDAVHRYVRVVASIRQRGLAHSASESRYRRDQSEGLSSRTDQCGFRTDDAAAAIGLVVLALSITTADAAVRIKDIANLKGVRENQILGYGLVIGLKGTGDTLRNSPFTEQSLQSMLDNMGINIRGTSLRTRNVAAVVVTADLPPFVAGGSRIDVAISSLGDASSLSGGTLVMTQLRGADGEVYAVAQGAIAVGGYSVEGRRRA